MAEFICVCFKECVNRNVHQIVVENSCLIKSDNSDLYVMINILVEIV